MAQKGEPEPAARPDLQVIGIGYAALDYLAIVPRMPRFDEAEAVEVSGWQVSGGGPASTALVQLAQLGVPAGYLGQLGDDVVGRQIRLDLERYGVDLRFLRHQPGMTSPAVLVLVEAGTGRRAFVSYRGQQVSWELTLEEREAITGARFIHLDGWHPEIALPAARLAKAAGARVSLDAYRLRPDMRDWIGLTEIVIATESFPSKYTGEQDLVKASEILLGQGPQIVVTTLSERGCLVATSEGHFYAPGFRVQVVDTTGAGDIFHGAFLYGLLQGWDLARTARFANGAGALACRKLGGRSSIPTLAEVEALIGECS